MTTVPTFDFEKTIFASNTSGSPSGQARHTTGCSTRPEIGLKRTASQRLAQPKPRSFDRMCFLFTMSDTENRRRTTEDRSPRHRPASPQKTTGASQRTNRPSGRPDAFKLILHRDLSNRDRASCPLSSAVCFLNLVEPDGIEPTTSCLQSTRSGSENR